MSICAGDCDDTDPNSYEGDPELCDGIGNDDDGLLACSDCDDQDPTTNPLAPELCDGDCINTDPLINPTSPEICGDLLDNNCNDQTDEACPDQPQGCDCSAGPTAPSPTGILGMGFLLLGLARRRR